MAIGDRAASLCLAAVLYTYSSGLIAQEGSGAPVGNPVQAPPANADTRLASPPVWDPGIEEVHEVRDPLPIGRVIDLTAPADDVWERIRQGFAMPDLASPLVLDRQIWYASRPTALKIMAERSRRYLYHIVEELERRGMPTELALLPMVESAFNPMAYSRAKASGLWQFIPSTGKSYNLQQNWWYDARRDIVASTTAALDYLQFLYDMHGDWHLALASYNWGENAVARAIEKNRARGMPADYPSLTMPAETRFYVPKLQALKNIVAHPVAFGIDLDPIPNQPYFVTVAKTEDIDIRTAARLAEMPVDELIALNPAHNRPVITAAQSLSLVLPADRVAIFEANLANHDKPLSSWKTYVLKSGERLERVATRHGISLTRLRQVNGIVPRSKVAPGLQILVPVQGSSAAQDPLPAIFQPPSVPEPRLVRVVYTVRKGDTLPGIAQRYHVSADDLRRWNQIGRLAAGQKIVIQQSTKSAARPAARTAKPGKPVPKKSRPAAKAKRSGTGR